MSCVSLLASFFKELPLFPRNSKQLANFVQEAFLRRRTVSNLKLATYLFIGKRCGEYTGDLLQL